MADLAFRVLVAARASKGNRYVSADAGAMRGSFRPALVRARHLQRELRERSSRVLANRRDRTQKNATGDHENLVVLMIANTFSSGFDAEATGLLKPFCPQCGQRIGR
ncbi:hypothetical protein ABH945_001356 [Paraburkholderia sp. GAS333]